MKRILAFIFGWELVWTEDYDGELRLRRTYKIGGKKRTSAMRNDKSIILNKDGTTSNKSYVKNWYPAN